MSNNEPRYYRVSPQFWTDPKVSRWSADAKFLAFYILTCEHRTSEGLFVLKPGYVCADLEWSRERFTKSLGELTEARFVKYDLDAQVCLIVNALKYQRPQNPNVADHACKQLASLPATPLTRDFVQLAERFSKHLTKSLRESFPEWFGKSLAPALALTQEEPSSLPAEDDTANEQPQKRSDGEKSPDLVATGFEKFWETYPKQPNGIRPDKRNAQAQWKKLKPDERDRAMTAVHHYRRDVDKRGSISKHAFRWLRDRTFEDWQAPAESTSEPTPPYLLPVSEQEVDPEGQARVEALIGGIHMGGAE